MWRRQEDVGCEEAPGCSRQIGKTQLALHEHGSSFPWKVLPLVLTTVLVTPALLPLPKSLAATQKQQEQQLQHQ